MTQEKGFYNVGTKVSPLLKSYYGTGGDLNVDEIHEVILWLKNVVFASARGCI
jgi:hypothetical protein